MNRNDFADYILHTPENSNRSVVDSVLKLVGDESTKESFFKWIKAQGTVINPTVLETYLDKIYQDFGKGVVYTVRIDTTNSNPLTCCEYMDDAVGMEKGSSAWDSKPIFKDIKPCVFKDGKVSYYLNPNDYNKKIDGSNSVLTGADGDVMVEFSKFAYRIYDDNERYVYISISNDADTIANDLRFSYLPFTREENGDCSKTYIGAYHGTVIDGKLRSVSGQLPTVKMNIGEFRTAAQANGAGYEQFTFYQLTMLQCLYLIRYGNLNSQNALGAGYVDAGAITTTGNTNVSGMYSGDISDGAKQVKFAGIEDFYGNVINFVDGLYCTDKYHVIASTNNFSDVINYTDLGAISITDIGGIMESIWGDTALGFISKSYTTEDEITENSFNEYFSDFALVQADSFAFFGAGFRSGAYGGAFYLRLAASADISGVNAGARLSFY